MNKKTNLFLAILHLLICLIIVKVFRHSGFIRGFLGDVFFMGLMFYSLKAIYDFNKEKLLLNLLFLAYIVEISQYFKILEYLNLSNNAFLKLLFGATFDVMDLVAYSIGTFLVWSTLYFQKIKKDKIA